MDEVFLRNNNARDLWVCAECETENSETETACVFCGGTKRLSQAYVPVAFKLEEVEKSAPPPTKRYTSTLLEDQEDTHPIEEKHNTVLWITIVALILLILLILFAVVMARSQ